ncbi:MAG: cytochrome c [Proteobacteria bacterium]|nr:cytochrome c [Pseudomonadota bacterium]
MFRAAPLVAVGLALVAGMALAAVKPNTPTPMPRVRAQMKTVIDKTSTDLFNAAGEADPANGADAKTPDAAGWIRMKGDADKLRGVADWMLAPANGKTAEANWTAAAKAMSAHAATASKAAGAHDAKALAQAANDLSDTCTQCHKVYKKQN